MAPSTQASPPDMPIQIKTVLANKDENRRFILPLRDLGADTLPNKVRFTWLPEPYDELLSVTLILIHKIPDLSGNLLTQILSSVPYSTSHRIRVPFSSAIPIALPLTSSWIATTLLSTSSLLVPLRPSLSSRSKSRSLISRHPSLSRCLSKLQPFLSASQLAPTSTLTSLTQSRPSMNHALVVPSQPSSS